jgi:4-hydroxybenzoate polyprenyltransferase
MDSQTVPGARAARLTPVIAGLLQSLRPHQWTKNGFIFLAPLFAHQLHRRSVFAETVVAFVLFCGLSGAVYLINDVVDLPRDAAHPEKRNRPIASGRVPVGVAIGAAVVLAACGLAGAFLLAVPFGWAAVGYVVSNLLYSFCLKRVVILDVMSVAFGFLLRAVAGGLAVGVPISHWLVLCMTLLALFLAFCKRRQELTLLAGGAADHRASLKEYTPQFLDHMISVVAASTLIAYSLYALSPEVMDKLGTPYLGLTIPFVVYGLFRYLYLVHMRGEGGNPSRVLLADRPIQIDILLWGITVLALIYWRPL